MSLGPTGQPLPQGFHLPGMRIEHVNPEDGARVHDIAPAQGSCTDNCLGQGTSFNINKQPFQALEHSVSHGWDKKSKDVCRIVADCGSSSFTSG